MRYCSAPSPPSHTATSAPAHTTRTLPGWLRDGAVNVTGFCGRTRGMQSQYKGPATCEGTTCKLYECCNSLRHSGATTMATVNVCLPVPAIPYSFPFATSPSPDGARRKSH